MVEGEYDKVAHNLIWYHFHGINSYIAKML